VKDESRWQIEHRERKRARGECGYGGCHEARVGAKWCAIHALAAADGKIRRRLRKKTTPELLEAMDMHRRLIEAIDDEIRRRGG
jgi:hypothetical protein